MGVALAFAAAFVPCDVTAESAATSAVRQAAAHGPRLSAPWTDSSGIVRWTARQSDADTALDRLADQARKGTAAGRLAAWAALAADPILEPYALLPYGQALAAAGDTSGADSVFAGAAAISSLWRSRAELARVDLAIARGQLWRAETMIASIEGSAWIGWPLTGPMLPPSRPEIQICAPVLEDEEPIRAAFLRWDPRDRTVLYVRSAEIHAAFGDTLGALQLCASAQDTAAPLVRRLMARLSRWERDRNPRSIPLREAMSRASSAARVAPGPVADRSYETFWAWNSVRLPPVQDPPALDRMLRLLDEEEKRNPDPDSRSRILQGRARLLRRFGRIAEAEIALDRAESLFVSRRRATWDDAGDIWWQRGMVFETDGRWHQAFEQYVRFCRSHAAYSEAGYYRAGLMAMLLGARDTAVAYLERGSGEGAQFWLAITLRRSDPPRSEGLLRGIACTPGYTFYEVAARETLGLGGWPAVAITPGDPAGDPGLLLGRRLVALGENEEAARLAERWEYGDVRVRRSENGPPGVARFVAAAALAYAGGNVIEAARLVEVQVDSPPWGVVPWEYPPIDEDALRRAAKDTGIELPLLRSLAWHEVRAMPSIAPSAGILRRASEWAREARELGGLPVALAAYQVGPNVAGRWKDRVAEEPRRAGGEALVCELAVDPSVSQWVRSVLAARAAYAELRPTTRQP